MLTLKKISESVERSKVLVKKRTLKPRIIKKRIRNLLDEKLKNNNIALARALSKEKQKSRYLYSQNIKLTRQVQDMQGSLKKREDIISGILKNSSEALKLLVQATDCVTTTTLSCQQVVGNQQTAITNQLKSSTNSTMSRRESVRKSSGKSPARGVVQPMVSGHTITKPVINICRINKPRLIASPNVSDIEESTEVPSPSNSESHTPIRLVNKQRRSLNRHINSIIMPQRIRRSTSSRVSDEDEQISPPPPPQPEPSSTPQSSPDKSDEKESSEDSPTHPTYGFDTRLKKKKKKDQQSEEEDPLEGPSWPHNNSLSSEQNNSSLDVTSSINEPRKLKRSLPKIVSDELLSPKKLNDVTMIINRPLPSTQNESFNVDKLKLPERLNYMNADPQTVDIEPKITKTIRLIGNNNLRLSTMRTKNIFNNSMNPKDISMIVAPVPEPIVDDSSDDDRCTIIKFNSSHNRGVNKCIVESSSESEDSLPPSSPKKTIKRKIIKRKDPSTVKVVSEKLSHVNTSDRSLTNINTSSYNLRNNISSSMRVLDQESDDSDSSNISTNSRASSRPKRQKAPLNLKEPKIRRKLRG